MYEGNRNEYDGGREMKFPINAGVVHKNGMPR
jgi:hypothetical protein